MARGLEPSHCSFPLTGRLVRILIAVVEARVYLLYPTCPPLQMASYQRDLKRSGYWYTGLLGITINST